MNTTDALDNIVQEFMKKIYNDYPGAAKFAQLLNNYINNCCNWQVICSDPTSHTWFKFEENVWEEDKGANKIKLMIVQNLIYWFEKMYDKYDRDIINYERQTNNTDNNSLFEGQNNDVAESNIRAEIL